MISNFKIIEDTVSLYFDKSMFNTTRVWTFNSISSLDSGQLFKNASKHIHWNEESSMVKQSNINIKFSRNCKYCTKRGFIQLFQKTLEMIMRHKQREKEGKKNLHSLLCLLLLQKNPIYRLLLDASSVQLVFLQTY